MQKDERTALRWKHYANKPQFVSHLVVGMYSVYGYIITISSFNMSADFHTRAKLKADLVNKTPLHQASEASCLLVTDIVLQRHLEGQISM